VIERNLGGRLGVAAAALLALAGCGDRGGDAGNGATAAGAPVAATPPPAGTSWTDTVTKTAEGGFVMGNPNAPVKLVEYGSLTCSHCAAFSAEATPELTANFVAPGKVSYEFRNFVRDGIDVTAALLTRCRGAEPFFKLTEQMFGEQAALFERAQKIDPQESARIAALPPQQQFAPLARLLGLDQFFKVRGLPTAQAEACLADPAAVDELTRINTTATERYQIAGTPTFLINGEVVQNAADWAALKPKLVAATGG